MIDRPYSVNGETVTSAQVAAAIALIDGSGSVTYSQVGGVLHRNGVTWENHERAADRLLQRLRKAGRVKFNKGRWSACKIEEETVD